MRDQFFFKAHNPLSITLMIYKTLKHSLLLAVLAILAAGFISGCSSSSTSQPGTNTTVTPKTGSTYTYNKHEADSSQTGVTSGDTLMTATVISSGTSYAGKDNVVTIYDDFDTLRYSIESNGDISFYRANFGSNGFVFNNPSPWLTLPFGSKQSGVQLFKANDTILVSGQQEILQIIGTADYIGNDEVDTNGIKLASGGQARLTIAITGLSPIPVTGISSTQTFSFDGSVGNYFHSISKTVFPDVSYFGTTIIKGSMTSNDKKLKSYVLIK